MEQYIGGGFITFKYRYRKQILIGIIIIVIIIGIILFLYFWIPKNQKKDSKIKAEVVPSTITPKKAEIKKEEVKVDIKGEINNPGIYSLKKEERVIDVINLAGGLTDNADTSVINLSKKITDEMVIIIYSKEEVQDFKKTKEKEEQVIEKCIQKDDNALTNDACIGKEQSLSTKISINTATVEELMTLAGIGESKAKDIIDYREKNGPFTSIEDLTKVPGIGESTLANIQEDITV